MPFVKEMENNFYKDDFEQMLRDTTSEFRMYPSRKVWHSIYNDLHPDRKWPSFAACLLLLTAILYIGVSNNNSISKTSVPLIAATLPTDFQNVAPAFTSVSSKESSAGSSPIASASTTGQSATPLEGSKGLNGSPFLIQSGGSSEAIKASGTIRSEVTISSNADPVANVRPSETTNASLITPVNLSVVPVSTFASHTPGLTSDERVGRNTNSQDLSLTEATSDKAAERPGLNLTLPEKVQEAGGTLQSVRIQSSADKAWMEDFAFHNLRNRNKWKTNLSFQYYITPSIGYRHLSKNNGFEPLNSSLVRTNENEEVAQQAAPNFEAGVAMVVGISKRLKLKSGLQFNFTNYNTYAHTLQHPTQTTVPLNEPRGGQLHHQSYNTTYGNVLGSNFTKLNNQTMQLSLPLGVDYQVAGNDKIKWYMGAGVQPSYIVSGNAYLISSDNKNFVHDDAMLRRWNASANLETFVSIKTPSGVHLNVGPQLRYQLLSTYNSKYSYTEKLYNVGIKIGVTKKL